MIDLPVYILWIAPLNVALHILLSKWGVTHLYQLHRPRWMPDGCNFCLYFWMSLFALLWILPCPVFTNTIDWLLRVFFGALILSVLSLKLRPV